MKDVRYLGHPRGAIPAKELPLRWYLLGLVESPPHDIPELDCCLLLFPCEDYIQQRAFSDIRQTYHILANKSAASIAKLPRHAVLLLVLLWAAAVLVLEALDWYLGCQPEIGTECSSATVAMAKRGPRIVS